MESREARDGAALVEMIAHSTIRGTQRGRMLQKVERADELAEENAELRRSVVAHQAELKHEREQREAELLTVIAKSDAERAELKVALSKLAMKNETLEMKIEKLEGNIEHF